MSFFEIAKCIFPSQRKWWVIDPCQGLKAKVSILIQLVSKCRWDFQVKPAAMIWISENLWTKVISWKCYEILGIGITLYFKQTHGTQYSIYSPKVSMPAFWQKQKRFIQHWIRCLLKKKVTIGNRYGTSLIIFGPMERNIKNNVEQLEATTNKQTNKQQKTWGNIHGARKT